MNSLSKKKKRKIFNTNLIIFFFLFFYQTKEIFGQKYVPLVNNLEIDTGIRSGEGLQGLLSNIFNFGITIAGLLAIIYIVIGGVQYMTTDSIFNKEEGKNKITSAVVGLIIALSSWLLINEINPNIFTPDSKLGQVNIDGVTPGDGGKIPQFVYDVNSNDYMLPNTARYTGDSREVMELAKSGIKYPNEELNQYALQKIKESGLTNLRPRDGVMYFKNPNNPTEEDWLNLLAAVSNKESGFNSNLTYQENFKNGRNEQVISTGLHQLSYESVNGYGFRVTTEQLKDPKTNIDAAVKIMKTLVEKDGYISYKSDVGGTYGGAARYWSVLRD